MVVFDVSAFEDSVLDPDDDSGSGEEETWLDEFTTSKRLGSANCFPTHLFAGIRPFVTHLGPLLR